MITKKDISAMVDGQVFETIGFMKGYSIKTAKNDKRYMDGQVELKGSVPFKVWSGALYDELEKYDYQNKVCKISGKVNEYNGMKSIILSDVKALEEGTYDASDFFEDKYQVDAYWDAFGTLIEKHCSVEAKNIFTKVMEDIQARFKLEFAARGYHDAVKGGLLAHTYKVTFIMTRVMKLYSSILKAVDSDMLVLGCALHDVGKVKEYTNGVIQGNGLLVSHHTFGVEILFSHKDYIIEQKGEEFFYRLLAVVEQHHGEYEETPRTVEAYLVHVVDNLESRFQIVNETFEKELDVVSIDSFKLN